jgi:MYXO-CTERM domain-containing protein
MKSSWIRSTAAVGVALACAAAAPSVAAASSANTPVDRVYVVQGVPGTAVNVAVDGKTVQEAVAAKAVVGPLRLTPGKHTISFSTNGWKVTSGVTISHRSSDVVLHWPADPTNKPVVTVFGNDLAPVSSNKGRLTVVHAAVVPPADIRVDKKVLFANIANGQYVSAEVPGGTYSVDVVPTGQTTHPLLGPVMLPVKTGVLTRVFAIGKPTNGSMDAIVQVLPLASGGSSAPGSVDAGSAGLVATPAPSSSDHGTVVPLAGGAALGLLGILLAGARRRHRVP